MPYLAPPEVNQRLSRAEELIRTGRKREARSILAGTYRYAIKNPRFWWAVARAARHKKQAIRALRRVVTLRPKDDEAWAMLKKLDSSIARPSSPGEVRKKQARDVRRYFARTSRILIFALIAAVILAIIVIISISAGPIF
jgi:ferric-dicitrate binding protein FerR (iron transport regulator)